MAEDTGIRPGGHCPSRSGRAQLSFLACAAGSVPEPLEKMVIFLTAPKDHNPAAPSSLSDECRRLQSLHEEFWLRWQNYGLTGQLEISHF